MDRELNDLVELGSISTDTAGQDETGLEVSGKFKPIGLSQD